MKNIFKVIIVLCLVPLTGCYKTRTTKSIHYISSDKYKVPKKEGKACANYPFVGTWFRTTVYDVTVETARQNGNISEISTIEEEFNGNLFNQEMCTVVRGN